MPEWITVAQASRQSNYAERTIRSYIAKGLLTAKKEGKRWLIDSDTLSALGTQNAILNGIHADVPMITIPLDRYEALLTQLGQLRERLDYQQKLLEDMRPKHRRWQFWRQKSSGSE